MAELSRKLEQAKTLLRTGNLEQATVLFREVATYDISRLQNKPWLRPRIEALVSVAQSYVKKIEEIKRQIEEE